MMRNLQLSHFKRRVFQQHPSFVTILTTKACVCGVGPVYRVVKDRCISGLLDFWYVYSHVDEADDCGWTCISSGFRSRCARTGTRVHSSDGVEQLGLVRVDCYRGAVSAEYGCAGGTTEGVRLAVCGGG